MGPGQIRKGAEGREKDERGFMFIMRIGYYEDLLLVALAQKRDRWGKTGRSGVKWPGNLE